VVVLAPVRALFEVPKRRREKPVAERTPPVNPQLAALEPDTLDLLAELARLQLDALGVRAPATTLLDAEMVRQFVALSPAVGHGADAEARLQQALLRAIEELELL
jgi:hypothetical protein